MEMSMDEFHDFVVDVGLETKAYRFETMTIQFTKANATNTAQVRAQRQESKRDAQSRGNDAPDWQKTGPGKVKGTSDGKEAKKDAELVLYEFLNMLVRIAFWRANPKFGTLLFEVESHGWVTGVSFAPGGGCVAFCSHDSTVSFVDVAAAAGGAGDGAVSTLRLSELPLSQLLFLQDGSLIGAGHAYDPMMFVNSGGKWAAAGTIKGKAAAKEEASGISATRKMFQAQAATGQGDVQSTAAKLDSMHQNLVCGLQQFGGSFGGVAAEFTSSSLDGKIVWWTRDELTAAMKGLKL